MSKIKKAVFWVSVTTIFNHIIAFFSAIYLARLLTPEDYGLVGILSLFTSLSMIFIDAGYKNALIRNLKTVTSNDFSEVFFINLMIGIGIYLFLFFLSPLIADFFHEPRLVLLSRILFINIIINALFITQKTYLICKLQFKLQSILELLCSVIGLLVAIWMAKNCYSYWSLVIPPIIVNSCKYFGYIYITNWKPQIVKRFSFVKNNFNFSIYLLYKHLFDSISSNILQIIIGKKFLISDVGLYSKATSITNVFSNFIPVVLNSIGYSIVAEINNKDNLINYIKNSVLLISVLTIPLSFFFFLFSKEIVIILLTEKWIVSYSYIQFLAFNIFLIPIILLFGQIITQQGNSKFTFTVNLLLHSITILTIIFLSHFGILFMIKILLIESILILFIYIIYVNDYLKCRLWVLLKDMIIITTITFVIANICIEIYKQISFSNILVDFTIKASIYGTFLFSSIFILYRKNIYRILKKTKDGN